MKDIIAPCHRKINIFFSFFLKKRVQVRENKPSSEESETETLYGNKSKLNKALIKNELKHEELIIQKFRSTHTKTILCM